ncbi:MAG TPA: M55 family metallopeptidase [Thermomicrobiaceae bacterium]|nr:M55 family metallopeptidase [Thermomicrobiaceae bacterium]
MKVYVSVDMEGISGIVHGDMMMPTEREYDRGRRLMTADTNAAVEGLVQSGADYVLVADGHGPMRNILVEDIHPAALLATGSGDARDACQLEGADLTTFAAAVLVGYHSMAKTMMAVHPHTIAGGAVAELRINGRPHGETGLNAAVLGAFGIPVIMVTGDQTTMAEARAFLGDQIETVAVKEARGRNAAICRAPAAAREDITAAAKRALGKLGSVPAYRPEQPWRLEVDFVTMQQCDRAARTAGAERLGPMGIVLHGDSPWEQYQNLWAALRSALYQPASWLS